MEVIKKSTLTTLCAVMIGLFFAVGCSKDDPKGPIEGTGDVDYPIDIPYTEYSLAPSCQWANLAYDNTVIIINCAEELQQYVVCPNKGTSEIDFSKQTLLLANGSATGGISEITVTSLQQLAPNEYALELEITLNLLTVVEEWAIALIVEKVKEESTVALEIIRLPLLQEPCYCIMDTLRGEWSWAKTYGGIGGNTADNEFKSIIKILSQNEDASMNYEVFVENTIFSNGSFQVQYSQFYGERTVNINLPHWGSSLITDENWIICFKDRLTAMSSKDTLCLWDGKIDGYCYYYYKVRGE